MRREEMRREERRGEERSAMSQRRKRDLIVFRFQQIVMMRISFDEKHSLFEALACSKE
jgi:hypothetical protein